mgnify:CR=1 FL=1
MKRQLCLFAATIIAGTTAMAHEPSSTPVDPGPVPDILFEYPVLAVFPDVASLTIYAKDDTTVSYVENNYQDTAKSINSSGAWTWKENDYCMYVDDHVVCFKLEDELMPGVVYDTHMRLLDVQGNEEAKLPVKWMLVRKPAS